MYAFLTTLTNAILKATGFGPVTPEPRQHRGGSVPVMTFGPRL